VGSRIWAGGILSQKREHSSYRGAEIETERRTGFGGPWVALCVAFALHVLDEALTGFLAVYNPTVAALRERWGWFPMPTFGFQEWLVGLILAVVACFALAPLAFGGARGLRPVAWLLAGFLNGLGHTLFTILGRTVESVRFARPAPGFYSSPVLLLAAGWMFVRLWEGPHRQHGVPSEQLESGR
jgi:hypothetical protein